MASANPRGIGRRNLVKSGLALAGAQIAGPFVNFARAAEPVRIGLDNPLTGPLASLGKNELIGCQMAVDEINAKGGVLGRPINLIVEDSTSGDAGTAVQKARKLIGRDKIDFLLGNTNSALSLAMAEVSNQEGILHIVPGGHTDAITGASCHWNVFRVCSTTQMEANAVADALIKAYGKKFYYLTFDCAFGHTLEAGLIKAAAALGGSRVGGDLIPQKKVHLAGAQQELEPLEGLPPEARIGTWVMEWYWNQPDVPHVADFVEAVKKRNGRVPTARTWFGYVSVWTCALAAAKANSVKAIDMAKALQDFHLPPEIALGPNPAFYRAGQNQLLATLFVGNAQAGGSAPDDLFKVAKVVDGAKAAGTLEESGCKMTWPT
jgi:branched-chain amino acid transport system substrate-binding protein